MLVCVHVGKHPIYARECMTYADGMYNIFAHAQIPLITQANIVCFITILKNKPSMCMCIHKHLLKTWDLH